MVGTGAASAELLDAAWIALGAETSPPTNLEPVWTSPWALSHPLVDNFRTFEWPKASDLQELVAGSRA